jgi:L-aspartate oxidase
MWDHAGIDRSAQGLQRCFDALADIRDRLPEGATEEMNMVQTARLIARSAYIRRESRGGHFRDDYPRLSRWWEGKHIEW